MRLREARDFLVEQIVQQAALEAVPLSDLERRMMYFTESSGSVQDPIQLNKEFEAHYDTATYEKKVSSLMHNAYKRLRKESLAKKQQWDKCTRTLRKGDHYILVMWGHPLSHASLRDWAIYLVILGPVAALYAVAIFLMPRRNGTWPYFNYIPIPNPRVMQVLFLALLAGGIFFPHTILRPVDWCLTAIDKFIWPEENDQAEK